MLNFRILFVFMLMLLSFALPCGAEEVAQEKSFLAQFNETAFSIIFYDISGGAFEIESMNEDGSLIKDEQGNPVMKTIGIPLIVFMLAAGAIFFTLFFRLVNFRMFKHAIDVVRGRYDNPKDKGEISHFRALTSALSATVGLGNIAGVAVAIQMGGPGAIFWMIAIAFFGMTSKFISCTLAQLYRKHNANGTISGGPMYYLDMGLKDVSSALAPLGKVLAILYAIMVMGGALGGGNMFQVNQTAEAFRKTAGVTEVVEDKMSESAALKIEAEKNPEKAEALLARAEKLTNEAESLKWKVNLGIGIFMLMVVGAVIIGGIKRIGAATSKIIPFMCGIYVLASIIIIVMNASRIPETFQLIFQYAFSSNAIFGGTLGILVTGVKRAAFSNEAGLGSAAIVHAAAKTDEPVREGIVAMLGPFIDTVIICTMTALVVVVSGAWNDPNIPSSAGVALTSAAFGTVLPWFPYILTGSIMLFAYSTMISWCYYGERGWIYLIDNLTGDGNGLKSLLVFRLIFLGFIIIGATNSLKDVLDFSDVMILSMAFPNIIGCVILAPKVWTYVKDYCDRYRAGELKTYS